MASSLAGFVEGVFVEVLWEVERVAVEGRREGQRITESVWWRGEVIDVKRNCAQIIAKIKYDPLGGFRAHVGHVRVFPLHMHVTDAAASSGGDMTQLRWRYYESSGDMTYNTVNAEGDTDPVMLRTGGSAEEDQSLKIFAVQQKVEQLSCRFEQVDRLVQSQRDIISFLSGARSSSDGCCERLIGLLRHKLAAVIQKPLHNYKHRNKNREASNLFDLSCAGSIRVDVDCTVEEFETVCRFVKGICEKSCFRVDGRPFAPFSQMMPASLAVAEILFDSLYSLCRALGIRHETNIMHIAKRERSTGKMNRLEDAPVRVSGSFLVDRAADDTPAAILVSRAIREGVLANEQFDILTREDQELDQKTVWYRSALRKRKLTLSSLLEYVYPDMDKSASTRNYSECLSRLRAETNCFTLRWRPAVNPNSKIWTRAMLLRPDFAGNLEVEVPYVLIRGKRGIEEMKVLVTPEFLKSQMH